ncbi:MAG: ATP-dependent RNA helicase [Treponemataceae bacterium]|nr:ATP-dependent RNA helicase [Treponemataceae bacterium]
MIYTELPVYQHKDRILESLTHNQVIVVESPTGSGKTTQMPVILYEAGYGKYGIIGVTQPRRIAAVSVSEFIAHQMGTKIPGLVGYKMRFEDKTSPETIIKIMTDGILLQEMKLDPYLSKYGVLIVDEAHERSLNIDFILGLLKRVLEVRPEFKVIISSATINAQVFSEYFGECPIVKIDAMTYPVTVVYDPPAGGTPTTASEAGETALLDKIVHIVDRVVSERREGDILVFLPGEKAIKDCIERLETGPVGRALHVLPLYGRLGKDEQERVFEKAPWGKTKVVVATNIAETSVTIDGITTVIDSGLAKLNYYNPRTFTSSLIEVPISKASCNQRKGRAGRTQPGTCYRLYTRKDYDNRPLFTTEEIYRTDLSEVVLRMAELGITNFEEFDFISPPNREGLIGAIETLNLLDALAPDNSLSDIGKMMAQFPLPPRHSRMIVEAIRRYPQVLEETLIAAAFLTTQSPYLLPPGEEMDARRAHHTFRDPAGDFVSYLKLFRAFKEAKNKTKFCDKNYLDEKTMVEIVNVKEQLELIVSDMQIPILSGGSLEDYLCAVGRGLIQFVCVREGRESYRSLTADRISIHPGSVMFRQDPQYIVAGEIVRTTRTYAMSVSPLSPTALHRISPDLYDKLVRKTAAETKKKKSKEERDFTNRIKILGEIFEIEKIKGAKTVILHWERLVPHLSELNLETAALYRDLRGLVRYKERYTILAGEKLSFILSLLPHLDLEEALTRQWPRTRNYSLATDLDALLEVVPLAGTTTLWKPGKTDLGFISLFTDGQGTYWFRCSRGFHTAINESIASLESLIDELSEEVDLLKKDRVNQTYRRLSSYLIS